MTMSVVFVADIVSWLRTVGRIGRSLLSGPSLSASCDDLLSTSFLMPVFTTDRRCHDHQTSEGTKS